MRGACKLAGLTCRDVYSKSSWPEVAQSRLPSTRGEKVYHVDVHGFLVEPREWDEDFAVHRAHMMRIPGGLTAEHWKIISCFRETFFCTGTVPTVIQTCEDNQIDLDELERLFPNGYHRGAVLFASLRVA